MNRILSGYWKCGLLLLVLVLVACSVQTPRKTSDRDSIGQCGNLAQLTPVLGFGGELINFTVPLTWEVGEPTCIKSYDVFRAPGIVTVATDAMQLAIAVVPIAQAIEGEQLFTDTVTQPGVFSYFVQPNALTGPAGISSALTVLFYSDGTGSILSSDNLNAFYLDQIHGTYRYSGSSNVFFTSDATISFFQTEIGLPHFTFDTLVSQLQRDIYEDEHCRLLSEVIEGSFSVSATEIVMELDPDIGLYGDQSPYIWEYGSDGDFWRFGPITAERMDYHAETMPICLTANVEADVSLDSTTGLAEFLVNVTPYVLENSLDSIKEVGLVYDASGVIGYLQPKNYTGDDEYSFSRSFSPGANWPTIYTVYVRTVGGVVTSLSQRYDEGSTGGGCPDLHENDDSPAAARSIEVNATQLDMTASDINDWYLIDLTAGASYHFNIGIPARNKVGVSVRAPGNPPLGYGETYPAGGDNAYNCYDDDYCYTDSIAFSFAPTESGAYYVKVFTEQPDCQSYSIEVTAQ